MSGRLAPSLAFALLFMLPVGFLLQEIKVPVPVTAQINRNRNKHCSPWSLSQLYSGTNGITDSATFTEIKTKVNTRQKVTKSSNKNMP